MPFAGKFADMLFPPPLLAFPLLHMVFVMLLRVIHDSFLCLKIGRGNNRAMPHSERRVWRLPCAHEALHFLGREPGIILYFCEC
jgi:hypothetical protein